MAYSPTDFQLFHLLVAVYDKLGMTLGAVASSAGTTTTFIDSSIPESFEDDSFNNWYAFYAYDAGGAGAAPEGEVKRVTDFVASTHTLTHEAFTAASALGDKIVLVNPAAYPLEDVVRLCNEALQARAVPVPDTSLTAVDGQSEYNLPVGIAGGNIVEVMIQTNTDSGDSAFKPIPYDVHPASTGSQELLIVSPDLEAGRTIKIIYYGLHPRLVNYYDSVNDHLPREVATLACALAVAGWRPTQEPSKTLLPMLMQQAGAAGINHPVRRYVQRLDGMPHWR